MQYKIVQGNTVFLHVMVDKLDVSKDYNRLVPCDMSKATDIKVELLGGYFSGGDSTLSWELSGINNNELVCTIPGTLELGRYTIKVSWSIDGVAMTSVEKRILQIVSHNDRSKLPIGTVEGETAGLFNLRYYLVTENQSYCPIHYVLSNATADGGTADSVKNGEAFSVKLNPVTGYELTDVKVIMNGKDVTDEVYADGMIDIPAASGYVVITASGTKGAYFYGASEASDIAGIDTTLLRTGKGSITGGAELTIKTTEEKPYIWFVVRVPLQEPVNIFFLQNGTEEAMHTTWLGDLVFFWTDKLVPGTYTYNLVYREN